MSSEKTEVVLIGVGPGAADLLPVRSQRHLSTAGVVCGFITVLAAVQEWINPEAQLVHLTYRDQDEMLAVAASLAAKGRKTVFCAWGDFNFSGKELVERVYQACQPYKLPVTLVPGISSLQIACALAGLAMEESLFITLHRRGGLDAAKAELLGAASRNERNLLVLPHTFELMPPALAKFLVLEGQPVNRPVTVFERLTHPDQREHHLTLGELAESAHEFSDLSVVVLPKYKL